MNTFRTFLEKKNPNQRRKTLIFYPKIKEHVIFEHTKNYKIFRSSLSLCQYKYNAKSQGNYYVQRL